MRESGALLRSEWTKLRSVSSTWWCAAVYLFTVGAFGWLAAATTGSSPTAGLAVSVAMSAFGIGQLALVVLGVLAVSSEFSTGNATATFVSVPRRTRLLVAKTAVVAAFCGLLTAALGVVCVLAARTLTAVPGGISLADPAVLRPLGVQVAAAVLLVVLSVGLGALLRSTAGGVALGTALVFVLPVAVLLMGGATAARVSRALPAVRVGEDPFLAVGTSWPVGLAVAAAWAVAAWVLAAFLLERRDV